ncbi:MgtC/SapB family protein [Paenibacillus contaminans]|uniref:Magnesium transporter MgtC n=1 Tax=Paenibacillus contaminans TaxID=450362 RepID=A0A329MLP7_9BACL|nr:MgtC/SapB family protein [Paenibacillus contaminans]RAV20532.1 magnesium transporter MgtC [Paenibacillus contaminans]
MLSAVILGGLIGLEREFSNHAAGFRTHILVCLGSATIMLLSMYGFSDFVNEPNVRIDPARLAAQVISGIGFLGAGAILRNGSVISGLTTAASVWVVAAIGLCIGSGFIYAALFATLLVLASLLLLNKWEKHLMRHRRYRDMTVKTLDYPGVIGKIASIFDEHGIQIINISCMSDVKISNEHEGKSVIELTFNLKVRDQRKWIAAIDQMKSLDAVLWTESDNIVLPHSAMRAERIG